MAQAYKQTTALKPNIKKENGKQTKDQIKNSKFLSYILRHGAKEINLHMDENGWIKMEDILNLSKMKKVTVADIKDLTKTCTKQRFALKETDGELFIRASQGHTIESVDLEMEEIDGQTCPLVYHGSYYKCWPSIKEQGLSRMKRNHIHFTKKPTRDDGIIRKSCEIVIEVDVLKLLQDDFKVYESENGVLLCAGNQQGFIPTQYITKCLDINSGDIIWPTSTDHV